MNLFHIVSHSYIAVANLHALFLMIIIVMIFTIVICFCTTVIVEMSKKLKMLHTVLKNPPLEDYIITLS